MQTKVTVDFGTSTMLDGMSAVDIAKMSKLRDGVD